MPLPTTLEGRVRGLAKEGDAVVDTEHGIVFAPGGVPGDRVRLEAIAKHGKLLRARRLVVLEPSPDRIASPCPHHDRCGGCPWITTSERAQLDAKRTIVERALARVARTDDLTIAITGPTARTAYRARARLAWARTPTTLDLGFREPRSTRIADVDACTVLRPELSALLPLLRTALAPHLAGDGELHLALGHGGRPVIALETDHPQPRDVYAALESLVAAHTLAGATIRAGGASVATTIGDPRAVGTDVEGRPLIGPPAAFSQAHDEINAALGAAVLELAAPLARVLELYAGHGNLTLALAARAAHVRAVEISAPATDALRATLADHPLRSRIDVITADASTAIPAPSKKAPSYDVVVLDPPRIGAKDAMPRIAALRPARIVYVSCDPTTLGRDLAILAEHGYRLDAARAFDMFPQTAHVETVARMIRAAS